MLLCQGYSLLKHKYGYIDILFSILFLFFEMLFERANNLLEFIFRFESLDVSRTNFKKYVLMLSNGRECTVITNSLLSQMFPLYNHFYKSTMTYPQVYTPAYKNNLSQENMEYLLNMFITTTPNNRNRTEEST